MTAAKKPGAHTLINPPATVVELKCIRREWRAESTGVARLVRGEEAVAGVGTLAG